MWKRCALGPSASLEVLVLSEVLLVLLFPHVADALIEQQPEDVVPVVGAVDLAAEDIRRAPEMAFEGGKAERFSKCRRLMCRSLSHQRDRLPL